MKLKYFIFLSLLLLLFLLCKNNIAHFDNIKQNIAIFILFKNNQVYLPYFFRKMIQLEQKYNIEYYIYENDSTDGTKKLLKEFMKNRKGRLIITTKDNDKSIKGVSLERGNKMAFLRNENKQLGINTKADYIFIIDSEVYFETNIFDMMIYTINSNFDYGMVTPFDICYSNYDNSPKPHYYDSLAMVLNNGISHKENGNSCMFENCKRCIEKRKKKDIHLDSFLLDRINKHEVKCAFGGLALLRKDVFIKVEWGSAVCEHHYLCNKIQKLGKKIIIDPRIAIITNGKDNAQLDFSKINKILKKYNI